MFILRRISKEFGQINTNLGEYYSIVLKESNKKMFDEQTVQYEPDAVDNMYGIVLFDDDNDYQMPLYSDSQYYIMLENGKTFDNISQK